VSLEHLLLSWYPSQSLNIREMCNYFTEMCSGSEAGSYLRLIDFVYHSTLVLRVIKKRRRETGDLFTWISGRASRSPARDTSGDTNPCKVTPVILHGVVSPDPG